MAGSRDEAALTFNPICYVHIENRLSSISAPKNVARIIFSIALVVVATITKQLTSLKFLSCFRLFFAFLLPSLNASVKLT